MQNEPSAEDPRDIWQQQSTDKYNISLEQLRLRAQQLAVKIRFQFLMVSGVMLALIVFDVWNFRTSPHSFQRAGFALAAGWALYSFIKAGQSIWPSALAKEAAPMTCLAFSRNELQRRINYAGNTWSGLAGPILFTLAVVVAPTLLHDLKVPEQLPKGLPAIVLLVIWIVMFNAIGRRERKHLRREMDELNGLDGDKLQRG